VNRAGLLTEDHVRALKPAARPYKVTDPSARGEGRLIIKVLPGGQKDLYYRYRLAGSDKTKKIGRFQQSPGDGGLTLRAARRKVAELVRLRVDHPELKSYLKHQEASTRAAEREADMASRRGSLAQLLAAYVAQLRARGASSTRAVEALFARSVLKPFPDLARAKATNVDPGDIQRILARLVERKLTREVNKLRSYLLAAFQHGSKLDNDPRRLATEKVIFNIVRNPVLLIPRIAEYERAGDRALDEAELARFWAATRDQPARVGCFLRFNLALGGQRITQLLRATWDAYDLASRAVTLQDSKGRTAVKRPHVVPLTRLALTQLQPMLTSNREAPGPFSFHGKRTLAVETLSKSVRLICEKLRDDDREKGREEIPRFRMGDLRRTCETLLAKIGISKDDRAQLLSHGLTGVQERHYDRNLYLREKRLALEKWERLLRRLSGERVRRKEAR
jgi:hypothetical protein